jgi:hypothetical protein
MTEKPRTPPPAEAPADFHWGIAYLREDIQDLRQDMHHQNQDLRQEIRAVHGRIDEMSRFLNGRIDETNRRMDTHFRWLMATIITMTTAMAGGIIAAVKL